MFASTLVAQVSVPRVRVSEGVMKALLVHKVDPACPADHVNIRDSVVLQAVISKAGDVASLVAISGHPMLIPRAIEAVKQWKFRPYLLNGIPVEVETTIHVEFSPPEENAPRNDQVQKTGGLVEAPPGVVQGLIVRRVAPVYPPLARAARIQGTVVLSIVITKTGEVRDTKLVSGHPMLAPAAMEAVKQWRYRPYMSGDQPVDVETVVRVNFRMADSRVSHPAAVSESDSRAAGGTQLVRVTPAVAQGLLASKVDPEYPEEARQKRIQGTVVLKANIDKEGEVARVELISGDALLAPAAMDAVLQWKYRPFLLNGEPMSVETTVQVKFSLAQ